MLQVQLIFPKLDIERTTWSLEALNFMKYFLSPFFTYNSDKGMETSCLNQRKIQLAICKINGLNME